LKPSGHLPRVEEALLSRVFEECRLAFIAEECQPTNFGEMTLIKLSHLIADISRQSILCWKDCVPSKRERT